MINELLGQGIVSLFLGVFMGIIDEWNKKVMFGIVMFILLYVIISAIIIGPGNIYSDVHPWWMFLFTVFFTKPSLTNADNASFFIVLFGGISAMIAYSIFCLSKQKN